MNSSCGNIVNILFILIHLFIDTNRFQRSEYAAVHTCHRFSILYTTKLFARVGRVNWSTGFAFGLNGGCSYGGFSSRAVGNASGGFAIKWLNAFRRRMSLATLEFSSLSRRPGPFFLRRACILLLHLLLDSRKDTPAFMPHYHRFETRHGGPMSFFIALLLAARFAEPARRRALQKLRHDSTKSRRRGFL